MFDAAGIVLVCSANGTSSPRSTAVHMAATAQPKQKWAKRRTVGWGFAVVHRALGRMRRRRKQVLSVQVWLRTSENHNRWSESLNSRPRVADEGANLLTRSERLGRADDGCHGAQGEHLHNRVVSREPEAVALRV